MSWIMTGTGAGRFDFCKSTAADVMPQDLIVSLARTARFRGMGRFYYSVAQHSILVGYLMLINAEVVTFRELREQGLNLQPGDYGFRLMQIALLHDGTETYVADIPQPLKALLPGYKAIENEIAPLVYGRFGVDELSTNEQELLKKSDFQASLIERDYLFPDNKRDWQGEHMHPRYDFKSFFDGAFTMEHALHVYGAHMAQYFPQVTGYVH